MQTAEVEAEWSIAPNDSGKPTIVSLVPGSPPVLLCRCSHSSRQPLVHQSPAGAVLPHVRRHSRHALDHAWLASDSPRNQHGEYSNTERRMHLSGSGGTLTYEHRNLGSSGQKLEATVNAQNLLMPEDSLGFNVAWKQVLRSLVPQQRNKCEPA